MAKKILIVTDDAGESFEILYAQQRFREAGYEPVISPREDRQSGHLVDGFGLNLTTFRSRQ